MIQLGTLLPMVSLALLFVVFATQAWRRSVTTVIYIVAVAVATNFYAVGMQDIAWLIVVLGATVALLRSVVNTEKDRFIKRDKAF